MIQLIQVKFYFNLIPLECQSDNIFTSSLFGHRITVTFAPNAFLWWSSSWYQQFSILLHNINIMYENQFSFILTNFFNFLTIIAFGFTSNGWFQSNLHPKFHKQLTLTNCSDSLIQNHRNYFSHKKRKPFMTRSISFNYNHLSVVQEASPFPLSKNQLPLPHVFFSPSHNHFPLPRVLFSPLVHLF